MGGAALTDEDHASAAELFVFLQDAVARRRASPTDDLLGRGHERDRRRAAQRPRRGDVRFHFVAGNETTRNLLSNGLIALVEHPDQRRPRGRGRRGADPGRRRAPPLGAADRRQGPPRGRRRSDRRGGGGGGQYLALLYLSANRDEQVFGPTATQLDVGRDPNPHLAFGVGEHFCLGAGLARLEGRVLLGELPARWPRYEVAGTLRRTPSTWCAASSGCRWSSAPRRSCSTGHHRLHEHPFGTTLSFARPSGGSGLPSRCDPA